MFDWRATFTAYMQQLQHARRDGCLAVRSNITSATVHGIIPVIDRTGILRFITYLLC